MRSPRPLNISGKSFPLPSLSGGGDLGGKVERTHNLNRNKQIVMLVITGKRTRKQIAYRLGVSYDCVRQIVHRWRKAHLSQDLSGQERCA